MKTILIPSEYDLDSIKNIMLQVMRQTPNRSMNLEEIATRIKVMEKVKSSTNEFHLEDAEHSVLLQAIIEFPYQIADQNIIDTSTLIKNAK